MPYQRRKTELQWWQSKAQIIHVPKYVLSWQKN